ncbi:hypothetical protein ACN28E_17835 [Archangium lansingense]|uniref:hypothetical protein n=1 Tax=Archangium lansingense TaxID=2995310 RepID=UPI003B7F07A8
MEHLSPELRAARKMNLDRLEAYIQRGLFPQNDDHPDARRPTFIDSRGRICAVGYLVEQALGRQAAEAIAAQYKYAYIREIRSPLLTDWLPTTGLEPEEVEMIQPAYDRPATHNPLYSSLEQVDGHGHASVATGLLLGDKEDGVPLQLALFLEQSFGYDWPGFGFYGNVALTKRLGSAESSTAPSNIDLGRTYARYIRASESDNWLVARAGALIPTGASDDSGSTLSGAMASRRLADAVLFQPEAVGARTSFSWLLLPTWCDLPYRCVSFRFDAGLDVYSALNTGLRFAPRLGAGVGYRLGGLAATLEVAEALYAEARSTRMEFHQTVGGSLRYLHAKVFQPGISFTVPLASRTPGWFLGFDLTYRP